MRARPGRPAIAGLGAVAAVYAAAALGSAATAHADDPGDRFRSPSGNIRCALYAKQTDPGAFAYCVAQEHSWASPLPPSYCPGGRPAEALVLNQGNPPAVTCHPAPPSAPTTLGYGQTRSVAAISCASEPVGVTCTDSSTGHYFRISRDSYQLG